MQRFRIDDHLRRHAKALGNLVAAGSEHFDEVKQYVKIHQLYAEALELYEEDQERQKAIHELHGDYMYSRNKYDQAALSAGELSLTIFCVIAEFTECLQVSI